MTALAHVALALAVLAGTLAGRLVLAVAYQLTRWRHH